LREFGNLRAVTAARVMGLLVLGLGGLGCVHTGFTPTTGIQLAQREPNCYLDMIFQGPPPYAHLIIGQVTTDSTAPGLFALGESNDVAVQRMKEQACLVGAHGLMQVGANSQGSWNNNGYSKSTSGGAVAFIYVDPYGRPLPPPNAPRIVIQQGAYGNAPPGYAPPAYPPPAAPAPGSQPPAAYPPSAPAPAPGAQPPPS
jgi:hypothetical protein